MDLGSIHIHRERTVIYSDYLDKELLPLYELVKRNDGSKIKHVFDKSLAFTRKKGMTGLMASFIGQVCQQS